ncbi:MAG: kinase/pyrophosphorylase [Acidobacteriota bacterium]|nr:MAG: kinase/pyrophosphorylase [Acidobacteriota bacterium]
MNHRKPTLFIVSDGRGDTCNQLTKAALVQFGHHECNLVRFSDVRTADEVRQIVYKAVEQHAMIFYTLVADTTRAAMDESARTFLIPTVDIMGPLLSAIHDRLKWEPTGTPGLLYSSERENFDRQVAIDYTLKHDDGQRPDELDAADVVLVGVSRASKSSTCFYLAYAGVKAANVPLLPGVAPLPQLLALDPEVVVGLRVNVMRLMTVRAARASYMGLRESDSYIDKRAIAREVIEVNRQMDRRGWRSLDVSYMAIEEIAKNVMRLRDLKGWIPL